MCVCLIINQIKMIEILPPILIMFAEQCRACGVRVDTSQGVAYQYVSCTMHKLTQYCVVLNDCVRVAPYVGNVGYVFIIAHLYTLVDDSECPWTMSFIYTLRFFP